MAGFVSRVADTETLDQGGLSLKEISCITSEITM